MWIYRPEDDNYFSQLAKCSDGDDVGECVIYFDPDDVPPSPAQGAMFAEALNVHEQTGLTPAQLQARVAELEASRSHLKKALEDIASGEITRSHCTGPHCVEELGLATADEMASRAAGALDWDAQS